MKVHEAIKAIREAKGIDIYRFTSRAFISNLRYKRFENEGKPLNENELRKVYKELGINQTLVNLLTLDPEELCDLARIPPYMDLIAKHQGKVLPPFSKIVEILHQSRVIK